MSPSTINEHDVEAERRRRAEELLQDHGPDWVGRYAPGSFGCHELLDRAALVADAAEEQILSHPACVQNPEWYALADKAVTALRELYQKVGAEHLESESS